MNEIKKTIAFGCAGEGRGHAARTIALAQQLQPYYRITIFTPYSTAAFIKEHLPDAEIVNIPVLNFGIEGHSINYIKTFTDNIPKIADVGTIIKTIRRKLKELSIAALISDFEPFTSIAASGLKIPVMNLNHPGIVLKYFSIKPDAVAAKIGARLMMPPANRDLICSFYGGDIGPIIRDDIKSRTVSDQGFFLVYTKQASRKILTDCLKNFPGIDFRIFPDPEKDFAEALAGCTGVIAPAGHQMLSEALYLRKPILAFPQKMQFEQRLNAIMLERSGWGLAGDINNADKCISRFLTSIDNFPYACSEPGMFNFNDSTLAAVNRIRTFIDTPKPVKNKQFNLVFS